jgi:tight adherence protein B
MDVTWLAALASGLAVACALLAARARAARSAVALDTRLRIRDVAATAAAGADEPRPRRNRPASALARVLARDARAERTVLLLQRAGSHRSPAELALLRLLLAAIAAIAAVVLTGGGGIAIPAAAVAALAGYMAPRAWLARRVAQRTARLHLQYIDMASLVASAVRSGFALPQALDTAARRIGPPLQEDLQQLLNDVRLGRPLDDCLREWVARAGDRDLQIIVTAILVQRHSGGNLAELLDNVAQTMRERQEVRQQVRSLTAYGRMVARIVSLYPLGIALLLTAIRRDIWGALWTTPSGWALLAIAAVLNVLAFVVLRRIVRVDY